MARGPLSSAHLLWLLLGALVPMLLLLDFFVGDSQPLDVSVHTDLRLREDGGPQRIFTGPLEGEAAINGLQVRGTHGLAEGTYPWRPTPLEGSFTLRLDGDFLETGDQGALGRHSQGFTATWRQRDRRRADRLGSPAIPCRGHIDVVSLEALSGARGMSAMGRSELHLDLICTGTGADLMWNSGDERVFTVEGILVVGAEAQRGD
ncbi:MAG: hypothetical protein VX899_04555 [Myxococcota bacterium]|nr:hypothetical protein [Myxococcota bacterium]